MPEVEPPPSAELCLAISDAMSHYVAALRAGERDMETFGIVGRIVERAGRDLVPPQPRPALAVNAHCARAFLAALRDYGYDISPTEGF